MESNAALLRATSGLERLIVSSKTGPVIKDSTVAQVAAAIYYQSNVLAHLQKSKRLSKIFSSMVLEQIDKDFGDYVDAQARVKRKSFHHVYEWGSAGSSSARLFKLNKTETGDMSFKVAYEFLPSKSFVPANNSDRRHVFVNKAKIMEEGRPLKISPRYSERLVFEIDGDAIFLSPGQSVVISKPGGASAKDSFKTVYKLFFSGNLVSESIKRSGFHRVLPQEIKKFLKLPESVKRVSYSFSPALLANQARMAVQ